MSAWTRRAALSTAFIIAAVIAGPASAQTKLKWAHVYEVAEPYHTQALWAAEEIKKRTSGRYELQQRLARAYQGVTDAWSLGVAQIPAVVVDRRYVVYGEIDVSRALAKVDRYRSTRR